MKPLLLIISIALIIIGLQDGIRILVDNQQMGIFSWVPGGFTVHIALDTVLVIGGVLLTRHASQKASSSSL